MTKDSVNQIVNLQEPRQDGELPVLVVGAVVVGEPAPRTGQAVGEVVVVGGVRPRALEEVEAAVVVVDGERGALAEEGEQVVVDGVRRRLGRMGGEVRVLEEVGRVRDGRVRHSNSLVGTFRPLMPSRLCFFCVLYFLFLLCGHSAAECILCLFSSCNWFDVLESQCAAFERL